VNTGKGIHQRTNLLVLTVFVLLTLSAYSQTAPDIQWQHALGSSADDYANYTGQTSDGGYVMVGEVRGNDGDVSGFHGGLADAWVVKLDGDGTIQWQKSLGGSAADAATAVEQTPDGGYIMAGSTQSDDGDVVDQHGESDCWVVKLDGVGAIQWQKCFGGSLDDYGNAIKQTSDGGYILCGESRSTDGDITANHGGSDDWVVKLDETGNIQWQKTLGGSGYEGAYSIRQTNDSGYILCGQTSSNDGDVSGNHGGDGIDCWIVKLDDAGNLQWQKTLGGSGIDVAESIRQTDDGGYVMAGYSDSTDGDVSGNHGGSDSWVAKLDNMGNIQWQRSLGGSSDDSAGNVQQISDSGYVVAGVTESQDGDLTSNHGNRDAWIFRLNAEGTLLWQKALGGSANDSGTAVELDNDGGYTMAGWSDSNDGDVTGNHGGRDCWVVKLGPDNVGISELGNTASFSLFPNPGTDAVNITFNLASAAVVKLQVYDAKGVLVKTLVDEKASPGERILRYSMEHLPAGTYELRLVSGNSTITKRLVKL
jgi:hypothetical protein